MSRMYSQTWMSATFISVAQPTMSKRTALALRWLDMVAELSKCSMVTLAMVMALWFGLGYKEQNITMDWGQRMVTCMSRVRIGTQPKRCRMETYMVVLVVAARTMSRSTFPKSMRVLATNFSLVWMKLHAWQVTTIRGLEPRWMWPVALRMEWPFSLSWDVVGRGFGTFPMEIWAGLELAICDFKCSCWRLQCMRHWRRIPVSRLMVMIHFMHHLN